MKPLAECRLYAFVDTAYLHGRAPEVLAQQLCDGGADLIQLRAKTSSPDEIRRMAEAILPITRKANVGLVINDHLEIAREVGAELCHLGQEDFFDAGLNHISQLSTFNSQLRIGLSSHAPAQAQRAVAAGRGLHRHRAGLCHRHETNGQTRDARIRPLGGGKCGGAVVRHRRNQLEQPR